MESQLSNNVPLFKWHIEAPYIFMDAEPTSTGLHQSTCDGNSNLLLVVHHNGEDFVFSRRFLWCSDLVINDHNMTFIPHPEYEWNENETLTESAEKLFGLIQECHSDELIPIFEKLEDSLKYSLKQEHMSCFD